ncbi:MAG: M23 family metallopeptidase [Pseudomonadota bacterium]
MGMRVRVLGAAAAAALLAGCDNGVAFPGFSAPPEQPEASPPPPPPETPVPSPPVSPPPPTEADTPNTETGSDTVAEIEDDESEADTPPATDTGSDAGPETPVEEDVPPSPPPPPPPPAPEPAFSYRQPGDLIAGSGTGSFDETVYAPDMVFPILNAPAFPQSMVWNFGGGIGGGDECDPRNYEYPWRDNFCETRSSNFSTPTCPVERVHLGQDIRVGDAAGCNAMRRQYSDNPASIARYRVVAAEDGVISNIGSYTVSVRAGPRIYRYLHLNMRALQVSVGDTVTAGQHLGYVSKDFGGTPTTFHLHFEIKQNTPEDGWIFVPPYTSLVESYARRENAPGELIPRNVGVAESPRPIPEGFIITE